MIAAIRIRRAVIEAMLAAARLQPGIECCGLLAGSGGVISGMLPAQNALRSATAYEIAPAELFTLLRQMRDERLDHLGIYHSHPRGENAPSPRDIELAFYPDTAYFIISPLADASEPVRAFLILDGGWSELAIEIV